MKDSPNLPGYSYERGPMGERYDEEYVTPVIVEDADSMRGKISLRAGFLGNWLLAQDGWFTDKLGFWLLRRANRKQPVQSAWVLTLSELNEERITETGAVVSKGPLGIWSQFTTLDEGDHE